MDHARKLGLAVFSAHSIWVTRKAAKNSLVTEKGYVEHWVLSPSQLAVSNTIGNGLQSSTVSSVPSQI